MPTYGGKKYVSALSPVDRGLAQSMADPFTDAIHVAEGNDNYGVQGHDDNPRLTTQNSVVNNVARWRAAGSPGKFVDFMQKRWAPIGAKNDPKNLNKNWAPNVRDALQKDPEVDYQFLKDLNLVKNPMDQFQGVA